jgi:phospholipid/cholesterol/gamma-HCH transport system permease protein
MADQRGIILERTDGGKAAVYMNGRLSMDRFQELEAECKKIMRDVRFVSLTIDLTGVSYIDSSGVLLIHALCRLAEGHGSPCKIIYGNDENKRIVDLYEAAAESATVKKDIELTYGISVMIGSWLEKVWEDFEKFMIFIGEVIMAMGRSALYPHTVRWSAVLSYVKKAGVDGFPVVGLIGLLVGLIMAFMASLQLKQFGANIYVASLVSIAIVKELGPIMTAIVITGRSGSAFAAEIGTMMVNEEVDALRIMGLDPNQFLVIPKILASLLVVPLLTIYADLLGIIGGLIVGVTGLDLTAYAYINQTIKTMQAFDITWSLLKSLFFAIMITTIVCYRGFQVRGGAESVGEAATSAVVSALFIIIIIDSVFAVMFHYIG